MLLFWVISFLQFFCPMIRTSSCCSCIRAQSLSSCGRCLSWSPVSLGCCGSHPTHRAHRTPLTPSFFDYGGNSSPSQEGGHIRPAHSQCGGIDDCCRSKPADTQEWLRFCCLPNLTRCLDGFRWLVSMKHLIF